jgi:hypothetical protein
VLLSGLTMNAANQLVGVVASGTVTGPVSVTTLGGTVTSAAVFTKTGPRAPSSGSLATVPGEPAVLSLWPVPVTDYVTIAVSGSSSETGSVVAEVVNSLGRVVSRQSLLSLGEGRHEGTLRVQQLPAGTYWVRVPGAAGARFMKE